MFNEISLQVFSLIYVLVLAVVYFVKRRYNFLESKIYKTLLGVTFITLLLDIANIYLPHTNIEVANLPKFIAFIYCIGLFFWLILFTLYLLLSMSEKKYEKTKELTKDHPFVYIIIFLIIILFALFTFYQVGHIYNFFDNYYGDIQIIYIFGIICSIFIMLISIIFNKKIPGYKNWSILASTVLLVIVNIVQIGNPTLSIIGSGISRFKIYR